MTELGWGEFFIATYVACLERELVDTVPCLNIPQLRPKDEEEEERKEGRWNETEGSERGEGNGGPKESCVTLLHYSNTVPYMEGSVT